MIKNKIDLDEILDTVINKVSIVLYNDDHNAFGQVMLLLVHVCKMHPRQAEQCTTIVDKNGKCEIKVGSRKEVTPIYQTLLEQGLDVRME